MLLRLLTGSRIVNICDAGHGLHDVVVKMLQELELEVAAKEFGVVSAK